MKNNSIIPLRLNINFQLFISIAEACMPTSTTSSITSDNSRSHSTLLQFQKHGLTVKGAWTLNSMVMKLSVKIERNGGGVALFVDKNLIYKVVENMSTVINMVLECVTFQV